MEELSTGKIIQHFWDAKNILINEVLQYKIVHADYYDRESKNVKKPIWREYLHLLTHSNPCLSTPVTS
jgi:hypothetical protein